MLERMKELPKTWQGLWHRTLLEKRGAGSLTNDRPAQVYWLQTGLWHADLRIPEDRPDFAGVSSLAGCSLEQLRFIAGQEGFCGVTRVEGHICTWSRLFDLNPGTALDVARMRFEREDFIVETGIAEDYTEHWECLAGSRPGQDLPQAVCAEVDGIFLASGNWAVQTTLRGDAPEDIDLYTEPGSRSREHLLWQASLALTLCERTPQGWIARLSTHPWLEGQALAGTGGETGCA
ncbi:hypothetical protein [Roseibium sp.]|uniref:hypothetical protein n=1 Tax=Roseibium sp. TaxID=1936156 RepID=UPI0032663E18